MENNKCKEILYPELDLAHFHGTTHWYRFSPLTKAVLTDGTKCVADTTSNMGLMQDIGIDLQHEPKLSKALDNGLVIIEIETPGFGLKYRDSLTNKVLKEYPLYGYPPLKIELWSDWIDFGTPCIYLPSER